MNEYKDKVLLGGQISLLLYKFNKKNLVKVSEMSKKFNLIFGIEVIDERIFVIDAADSVFLVKYSDKDNKFYEICDDLLPKYVTSFV